MAWRRLGNLAWVAALLAMASTVPDRSVQGHHVFRQTHVAANIDMFLAHGVSLRPETYNADVPGSIFDFPIYQWVVTAVVRTLRTPPVPTARALSLLAFAGTLLVLGALLRAAGLPPVHRAATLALFALAPVNLFYDVAPMVDGLAILLAYVSLYGFVRWWNGGRASHGFAMAAAGCTSALIKPPIYLPVFVAIAIAAVLRPCRDRRRAIGLAAAGACVALTVLAFGWYSLRVNGTSQEIVQGSVVDRLTPGNWSLFGHTFVWLVLNPLTLALAVIGGVACGRRDGGAGERALCPGLAAGAVVTVLAFFGRYRWHDYYQLSLVLPAAVLAGGGAQWLWSRLKARPAAAVVAIGGVAVVTVVCSFRGRAELAVTSAPDEAAGQAGAWLQETTEPDDFIFYVVDGAEHDYSPAYLYYARRHGYNLDRARLSSRALARLRDRFAGGRAHVWLFCPAAISLGRRIESLPVRLRGEGAQGRLYEVPAHAGEPSDRPPSGEKTSMVNPLGVS